MRRAIIIITPLMIAFWPVWRWYAARLTGSGDETWGLLALATAAGFIWRGVVPAAEVRSKLLLPLLLVLLYVVTYQYFPPLLRAIIALTAVGCALSQLRFGRCLHPGILGLLYLSLPVIPSLQFYGGYPLRAFVAAFAAPILRMSGYAVVQEGTCLNWAGKLIWVDAPCSGIRMLWVGLYLTCSLVCLYELPPLKTLLALVAALVVIVFGNVFRATALFYLEARIFEVPHWTHDYAGVIAFAVVACVIVASVRQIRRIKQCDTVSFT